MSAVLGVVRGHHGAILIDSSPGGGTTIRVLFPLEGAAHAISPVAAPTAAAHQARRPAPVTRRPARSD